LKRTFLAFCAAFLLTVRSQAGIAVWIDTDPSVAPGGHEVDDGLALLQAFRSPELSIRGISVVFGNAPLEEAFLIGQHLARDFGPAGTRVYRGASSAQQLGVETEGSRALEAALKKEKLTVIALGPVTNIGTVLRNHPELGKQIAQIIVVAGRRPYQKFSAQPSAKPFRDFNFEMDAPAMQALLNSKVPLVLTPWEVSSKVWLGEKELARLRSNNPSASWVWDAAGDWLQFWQRDLRAKGFNPFDTLDTVGESNFLILREDVWMSLPPPFSYSVPEQTQRVARAAFPKNTLCLRLSDELGTIFKDQDFADLFPPPGQPAQAPFRLALVTVLQFLEGLSDRAAADAVRSRIDWKYLLCLELDDAGFDDSVLCEFRARLLDDGAEHRLFDRILTLLQDRKLVRARGRQRTDSTHVVAAVRALNRLERVIETLRAALNVLATAAPDWVRAHIPAEWVDRYGKRAEDYDLPSGEKQRQVLAEQVGRDGDALLVALWSREAPAWMRALPAAETLRQVWIHSFLPVAEGVHWRAKDNVPPSGLRICSPYDAEARYAHKRSTTWVGYKVHLTETCEDDLPSIITQVETTKAIQNDNEVLPQIHQELAKAELLPSKHLVDAGYVEATQLVESQQEYGIELIGPVQGNGRWQQEQGNGFDISHFKVDWSRQQVTCPAGKASSSWKD